MQPQSQFKNYMLFAVVAVGLIVGFSAFRDWMYPVQKQPLATPEGRAAFDQFARLAPPPTGVAWADAASAVARNAASPEVRESFRAAQRVADDAKRGEAAAQFAKPPADVQLIHFGGDDYFLSGQFTPWGAGVHSLSLNRFESADRMGLPETTPDGKPVPLQLLPPSDVPSFAIYHYPTANEEVEHPYFTAGRSLWQVVKRERLDGSQTFAFSTDLADVGVRLTKTFTLRKGEYHLGLSVKVERLPNSKEAAPFRYQLTGGHKLPIEGEWYTTVYRNALTGWVNKQGVLTRQFDDARVLGTTNGGPRYKRNPDNRFQYAAVAIQYFASAIVADDDQPNPNFIEFVRATDEGGPDRTKPYLDDFTVRTVSEPIELKAGEPVEHKYLLYHGPIKVRLLKELKGQVAPELVDRYETTLHLNTLTDYGGWGIWTNAIVFFTNLVHGLLGLLRRFTPEVYGQEALCIVLVTVIVRGLMFPLSKRQAASMAKTQEQMAKLQPEMKKLKEKYKNAPAELQTAQMELYRKHGINPLSSLGGCFMMLVQMPIFMGLYFALQESFFFRLQPFLWIRNLAAPDMAVWWTEKIPWISRPEDLGGMLYLGPYLNVLPIAAIVLMGIQQALTMPPPQDEQQEIQQKSMKYMLVLFGFFFYKVPAGLCMYFIASTTWGLVERRLIKKQPPKPDGGVPANGKPAPRGGKGKPLPTPAKPKGRLQEWLEQKMKEASKK